MAFLQDILAIKRANFIKPLIGVSNIPAAVMTSGPDALPLDFYRKVWPPTSSCNLDKWIASTSSYPGPALMQLYQKVPVELWQMS